MFLCHSERSEESLVISGRSTAARPQSDIFRCAQHDRKRFNTLTFIMELFWWFVAVILFAVGLIGTVLHRMMRGAEKSVGWGTIAILVLAASD